MAWERRRHAWELLESLSDYTGDGTSPRRLSEGLTQTERLAYVRHVDAADSQGRSWLGRERVGRAIGRSARQVTRAHAALVAVGLLKVHQEATRYTPVVYDVLVPAVAGWTPDVEAEGGHLDGKPDGDQGGRHDAAGWTPDDASMDTQMSTDPKSNRTEQPRSERDARAIAPVKAARARHEGNVHRNHVLCGRICFARFQLEQFKAKVGGTYDFEHVERAVIAWADDVITRLTSGDWEHVNIDLTDLAFFDEAWQAGGLMNVIRRLHTSQTATESDETDTMRPKLSA